MNALASLGFLTTSAMVVTEELVTVKAEYRAGRELKSKFSHAPSCELLGTERRAEDMDSVVDSVCSPFSYQPEKRRRKRVGDERREEEMGR